MITSLIKNIKECPEDWDAGEYNFINKKSGFSIWIANGWLFCRPGMPSVSIGLISKIRLWSAYKKWCALAVWREK